MKPDYEAVIEALDLLGRLAEFRLEVIGTPPLGIDTEHSDIDIACSAKNLDRFSDVVREAFGHFENFRLSRYELNGEPTVLASFRAQGWALELFCQGVPTERQWGVRHFRVEQRLLMLDPTLRSDVRRLKQRGIKTEPAFAEALGLLGDPFVAMLDLETKPDDELQRLLLQRPPVT